MPNDGGPALRDRLKRVQGWTEPPEDEPRMTLAEDVVKTPARRPLVPQVAMLLAAALAAGFVLQVLAAVVVGLLYPELIEPFTGLLAAALPQGMLLAVAMLFIVVIQREGR